MVGWHTTRMLPARGGASPQTNMLCSDGAVHNQIRITRDAEPKSEEEMSQKCEYN